MGIIFAIISAFSYALVGIFSKLLSDKAKNPVLMASLYQLGSGIAFLFLFPFEPQSANITTESIILTILTVIGYSLFNVLGFLSNKYLDVSYIGILSLLTIVFTFLGSLIFLNEESTTFKVIGALLILIGNAILTVKISGKSRINTKGLIFRLIAILFLSSSLIIDGKNAVNFTIPLYGFITYVTPSILTFGFSRANVREIIPALKANLIQILLISISGCVGYLFLIKSYLLLDKSIAIPINNASGAIMVGIGILVLREKTDIPRKIFAMLIVFLGVIILAQG